MYVRRKFTNIWKHLKTTTNWFTSFKNLQMLSVAISKKFILNFEMSHLKK